MFSNPVVILLFDIGRILLMFVLIVSGISSAMHDEFARGTFFIAVATFISTLDPLSPGKVIWGAPDDMDDEDNDEFK